MPYEPAPRSGQPQLYQPPTLPASQAARLPPPTASAFAWERGRPARILSLPTLSPPPVPPGYLLQTGNMVYTLLKYRARRIGPANGSASPSPGFVPTGAGRGGFRPFGRCRFPQRRYAAGGQQDSDKEEQGPEGHQQDSQSGSCARPCAGGTPALPGSRHLMTSLFPVRGNRQDQGEARRRAGGGETPHPVIHRLSV